MYRLKIETDLKAFENELKRFGEDYKYKEDRLEMVDIGEMRVGFFNSRLIDEAGIPSEPSEARIWGINLVRQHPEKEWDKLTDPAAYFFVARLSRDSLRLTIPLIFEGGSLFVKAFLAHAKDTWRTAPIGQQSDSDVGKGQGNRKPYGKWGDTAEKLERLRKYRSDYIDENAEAPKWTNACQVVGITPTIAKKHDPELRKNWYGVNYR